MELTQIHMDDTALPAFRRQLEEEERAPGTVEKYLRDVRAFVRWQAGRPLSKEAAVAWKQELLSRRYAPATVNSMLVSLNRFLSFLGLGQCRVKTLRLQRRVFRQEERELSRGEYARLLETARKASRPRLELVMETICATGIRVSELSYITLEAVRKGRADVSLKGKVRTILLPGKLCRKLEKYARRHKIASGEIFLTRSGRGISRGQIWAEMKALCRRAGVAASKVFPHNLRHLFARVFYQSCRDVAKLADVLGHSSIETTRIYLISTGVEHAREMERLRLIC